MGYTQVALEDKIFDMYPELRESGISVGLEFDREKDAWIITFQKGEHKRYAFLAKKDADSCMDGQQCLYLGFVIGQYVSDLELEIKSAL